MLLLSTSDQAQTTLRNATAFALTSEPCQGHESPSAAHCWPVLPVTEPLGVADHLRCALGANQPVGVRVMHVHC